MSWNLERVLYSQFNTPTDILFDGRFVVVLDADGLHFIDYRNQQNITQDNLLGDSNFGLSTSKTITVTGTKVAYFDNHYYVTNADEFNTLTKINYATGIVATISLPEVMNSNIAPINGKLWFSSKGKDDLLDEQTLYSFDGDDFALGKIPVRHQQAPRYLATDYRGNVIVTNFNDVSISKFDSDTITHLSDIRLSREAYFIKTLSDRTCFVASTQGVADEDEDYDRTLADGSTSNSEFDTGMLYAVDTVLDTQQTKFQTLGKIGGIADQSGKLWMSHNRELKDDVKGIMRLTLSNNQVKFTKAYEMKLKTDPASTPPFNWNIEEGKFFEYSYGKCIKTETYDYEYWNGNSVAQATVPEYFFCIGDGYLQGFKIESMYTTQRVNIQSTAMISTGNHDYTGD